MDTNTDIPQSVHTQLDAEADEFLSPSSFDSSAPYILCFVLWACAEAYKKTNWPIIPVTKESCAKLLESNQEIRHLLQEAHRSGNYAEIRRRGE
jgi:hypothetical protein